MALDFPSPVADGAKHTDPSNNVTYTYDQAKNSWTAAIGGGGSANIEIGTQPGSPNEGDMWFEPTTGKLHVYVAGFWVVTGVPMDIWTDIPTAP